MAKTCRDDRVWSTPLVGGPFDGKRLSFRRHEAPLFIRFEQRSGKIVRTIKDEIAVQHTYQVQLGVTPDSLRHYADDDPAIPVCYCHVRSERIEDPE